MAELKLEKHGSPKGLERFLFRLPIGMYRARLGFLFGHRFLMICHVGRRSGEIRRTVLEVVVNDPDAAYVAAAWGSKAQWLQNVRANPGVTVYLGAKKFSTVAEMVSVERAQQLMDVYAGNHPKALGHLAEFMLDDPAETPQEQSRQVARLVPMVRLPKPG